MGDGIRFVRINGRVVPMGPGMNKRNTTVTMPKKSKTTTEQRAVSGFKALAPIGAAVGGAAGIISGAKLGGAGLAVGLGIRAAASNALGWGALGAAGNAAFGKRSKLTPGTVTKKKR